MSSIKVNNNTLTFLKIFFERANKVSNTITSFGNVFRNSKWADLKSQNIKKSFAKQWTYLFISVLLSLAFFLYFKTLTVTQFIVLWHTIKQLFLEIFYDMYYLILCFFLNFSYMYKKYSHNDYDALINVSGNSNKYLQENKNSSNFNFKSGLDNKESKDYLLLSNFKVGSALNSLNYSLSEDNSVNKLLSTPSQLINFQTYSGQTTHLTDNLLTKQGPNYNSRGFILSTKLNSNFSNLNTFTRLSVENPESMSKENPLVTEHLISQLLDTSKQYRWLTRNFFNTTQLNKNTNAITLSKSIIGDNLADDSATKSNVWLSNNSSSLTSNFINSNSVNQSTQINLHTYNSFESSRFFTNMRFFYLVNFRNLMPIKSVNPNTSSEQVMNTNLSSVKTIYTQEQNTFNSNFILNLSLSSPESLENFSTSAVNNSFNTRKTDLIESRTFNDFLTELTLESVDNMNTTSSKANSVWSVNTNVSNSNVFKS